MAINSDIDTELLIGHVENRRNLWDTTDENYKNRDIRQKTWEDVAASLIPEFETLPETEKTKAVDKIQTRWKTARDSFVRCRSKGKTGKSGSKKYNKYVFYENMKFLENSIDQNTALYNCSETEDTNINPPPTIQKPTVPEKAADKPDVVVQPIRKTNPKAKEKPRKKDFEETLIELMTKSDQQFNEDRSFFESLLPTLSNFNVDQKIQFRIDVLNTILRIKNDTPSNSNAGSYLPHPSFEMKMESPSTRSSTFSPTNTNYVQYASPQPDLSSSPTDMLIKNGMEDEED